MTPPRGTTRRLGPLLLAACLLATEVRPQAVAPDAELVAGIRQVKEGDFEAAVLTLDGVSRRLAEDPGRRRDLAQANLYLGIAYLGLEQRTPAKERFRQAASADPDLRLSADRFSPKVRTLFEEARREAEARRQAEAQSGGEKKGGGSKGLLIALGVGGAAGAVALAARGGSDNPPAGNVDFMNARFGTPVIECPNGFNRQPISFTILVDGDNTTSAPVSITSLSATETIVASSIQAEIGQANGRPASVAPEAVGLGRGTLTISSTLLCDNGFGDAPRFNEWSGHVTLTTRLGTKVLDVADRLHVNVP